MVSLGLLCVNDYNLFICCCFDVNFVVAGVWFHMWLTCLLFVVLVGSYVCALWLFCLDLMFALLVLGWASCCLLMCMMIALAVNVYMLEVWLFS